MPTLKGMDFEIINLSWHKRRSRSEAERTKKPTFIEVSGFQKEAGSFCVVQVSFGGAERIKLNGQVSHNAIKGTWSINAIDAQGNQVALRYVG